MQQLRKIFAMESEDTLQQMEDALLHLEKSADDREAVNVVFRVAHTLKGSAAIVGLDAISAFTHLMENILDRVRSGDLLVNADLIQVMLACHDHLVMWIEHDIEQPDTEQTDLQTTTQDLKNRLQSLINAPQPKPVESPPAPVVVEKAVEKPPEPTVESTALVTIPPPAAPNFNADTPVFAPHWQVSLRFHEDALRNGIDPLAVVHYLSEQGQVLQLHTLFDAMPPAADMNPEHCYIGLEIAYQVDVDPSVVEGMFDLVRDYCEVRILPPHSPLGAYFRVLRRLPEGIDRIGQIWVDQHTLTDEEWAAGSQLALPDEPAVILPQESKSTAAPPPKTEAPSPLNKSTTVKDVKARLQKNLQVDADKLDQLINLVGELVIANASISLLMQKGKFDRLGESISTMSRLVEEIRNSTLRMRMVHIGNTFNRFQRMVHDLSRDLGKDIELVISGAETELDKSMVEKINDPLMHLVRNAIDHGIETPDIREAHGKPPHGTLQLNAYHDSGMVVIEVGDDGKGLDRQKILRKATQKGIIRPDQTLTEQEVDLLMFEAGISTSEAVTELSGRGVGLDVVKRNVNALNGTIDVYSQENEGTQVRICLPLTLAIIDGFLFNVGKSSFVVPLDRVVECVEFPPDIVQNQENNYLNLRGRMLPLIYLHQLFQLCIDDTEQLECNNIVVVRYGDREAGLVVSSLFGEFQAVIKPLGKLFERLHGISGATILGSGDVALILDVPALIRHYASLDSTNRSARRYVAQ
jgi:two-component system chemotaxis sensor kinase CheA